MNAYIDNERAFAFAVQKHEVGRLMAMAVSAHQSGQLQDAAQIYRCILTSNARHPEALNNFSLMLDAKTALSMLRTALEVSPNYVDALINASTRSLELGSLIDAQNYLNHLQNIAPDDPRVNALMSCIASSVPLSVAAESTYSANVVTNVPLFSVIIPTHKRASLLDRALASIGQQSPSSHYEVIVISDSQDDSTDEVCRKRLRSCDTYIRRSGAPGPSESRNIGLELARGENILFLDDDDAWHPNLLSSLEKTPELRQGRPVYFNCSIVKESRHPQGFTRHSETFMSTNGLLTEYSFVKNQVHMSCFATPRACLDGVRFDPHMRAYEDWDFLLFLFERKMPTYVDILGSQVYEVDDETTDRRGSSQSATDGNAIIDYIYVYRRHPVSKSLRIKRAALLSAAGLNLDFELL